MTDVLNNQNLGFADGYLFVSYYINCEGKSGNFVLDGMDLNYKQKEFDETITDAVVQAIENLSKWKIPHTKEGETLDASYSMTFKFKNDKIEKVIL